MSEIGPEKALAAPPPGPAAKTGRWRRLLRDGALLLAIVLIAGWWQTRRMLTSAETAPSFVLPSLDAGPIDSKASRGKRVVLYFFAPWCTVCEYSISNLRWLRKIASAADTDVMAVALDYETADEVRTFAVSNGLSAPAAANLPVVLGDAPLRDAFRIEGYPSYYLLDRDGHVTFASVGYSTLPGLIWRWLMS